MAQTATARELLEKLVSFPTVSSETNLELMDWVEGWLAARGVTATRVHNSDKTKASLYAQIGPEVAGGVVLSGHTDVVPTKGQPWDSDPFEVVERGGRLYGRGTCDMKGFDALALAAVDLALAADLKRPLQIAFSYDEEVGCLGAPALIDEIAAHLPRAACAIIGEPSMMDVVTGHKGSIGFSVHLRGHEVHSSLIHQGVSAVMMGAKLIDWANRMNAQNATKTPSPMGALFTPPYSTLHVGKIVGGTAHNITAKDCDFTLAMRLVPDDPIKDWTAAFMAEVARIEGEMQAIHPDTGIDVVPAFDVPALRPEKDGAAEELARRITGDNASHVVSYGTEAGQFQRAGFSAAICGPGSITQAHQANEYLSLEQLAAGMDFMRAVVKHLSEE